MDFAEVENLLRSNSATAAAINGGSLPSETNAEISKLRLYGSSSLNRDNTFDENDIPVAKGARICSGGGEMAKFSPHGSNNGGGVLTQQTPSFSSPDSLMFRKAAFNFVRSSSGVRNPFTPSQWMELEQQALIYKYITAKVPIPPSLLIPIKKAMESCGFPSFSLLNGGWTGFHLGFSKSDPDQGRCRRTDGKKWRCSREAVADQKYCERHMNRGRHRSRKPVEGQPGHSAATSAAAAGRASKRLTLLHQHQPKPNQTPPKSSINQLFNPSKGLVDGYTEFGSVCSDSLLNPLDERKPENPLRQSLSREFEHSVGGPLGEALHIGLIESGLMLPYLPAL